MENVTGELMFSIKIIEYEKHSYKKNILFANLKASLGQTVTIRVEKDKRKISLRGRLMNSYSSLACLGNAVSLVKKRCQCICHKVW